MNLFESIKSNLKESWEEVDSKYVEDSDGFTTEYTMYVNEDGVYRFVFGDKDIYGPEDDYDWEEENEQAAREWFNSYKGFSEDFNESEREDNAGTYYVYVVDKSRGIPEGIEVTGKSEYPKSGKCVFHTRQKFTPQEMEKYGLQYLSAELMRDNPKLWSEMNYAAEHPEYLEEAESDFTNRRDFLYAMYDKIKEAWEAIDWHNDMYFDLDMDTKTLDLVIIVDWGDWKHDHAALDQLAEQSTHPQFSRTVVTEEDGSDCYSADHHYIYSDGQYKAWLNGPMNESESKDGQERHIKVVEMSNRLKELSNELANIAEEYDEVQSEDDVFAGTEDEYALELLDQNINELILNDPVLGKLDNDTLTNIATEIYDYIKGGYMIDFKWFLLLLRKYDALKAWGLELKKGGE